MSFLLTNFVTITVVGTKSDDNIMLRTNSSRRMHDSLMIKKIMTGNLTIILNFQLNVCR